MNHPAYVIPEDGKVMACLDVSIYNEPVTDYASWASRRLDSGLVCLHVLDRKPVQPDESDFSGSIGIDAGRHLLDELVELEARQNRLAMQHGRVMLEQACARASADGALRPQALQRHGPLVQALTELEDDVRLFVLGKRGEAADFNSGHLGANLERAVRAVHRPTLVASREFRPVKTFAIAFDGSPTTRKCVEMVAMSPLLKGLDGHLVVAGGEDSKGAEALDWAVKRLQSAGFSPKMHLQPGEAERVIAASVERLDIDLLVMGAYGHSRVRHLIVGSTTTAVLRNCAIPVLLLR